MDQLPTLEGTLLLSKETGVWEFSGQWAMGKTNGTGEIVHFTHNKNDDATGGPDGK